MPYDQNADKPGVLQMNAVKRLRDITESLLPLQFLTDEMVNGTKIQKYHV